MIIVVPVILCIIFFVLARNDNDNIGKLIATIISTLSGFVFVLSIFIIMLNTISINDTKQELQKQRAELINSLETESLSVSAIEKVDDFNSFILFKQKYKNNIWIGVFIPDAYNIEPINYSVYLNHLKEDVQNESVGSKYSLPSSKDIPPNDAGILP